MKATLTVCKYGIAWVSYSNNKPACRGLTNQ